MPSLNERLSVEKLEDAAEMLKAIAHPMRMAIVDLLNNGQMRTVTEIYEALGLEQAVVSNHLRVMKDRGVLNCRRDGKNTYYFLRHQRLSQVVHCIENCMLPVV